MASVSYKTDTLTVLRPARTVERGDELLDYDHGIEHVSHGWRVQPRTGAELHQTGQVARTAIARQAWATGPPDADVHEHDRIRWRGRTWEVDGPVQRWRSPTGQLAHTELTLRLVEG